jgi:hypothetical protein
LVTGDFAHAQDFDGLSAEFRLEVTGGEILYGPANGIQNRDREFPVAASIIMREGRTRQDEQECQGDEDTLPSHPIFS